MNYDYRLVVFTGDLSYSVRRNVIDLDDRLPGLSWLILIHRPRRTLTAIVKSQRFNIRKNGWRWITYQMRELAGRLFLRGQTPAASADSPGAAYELEALEARPNVRILTFDDIHGASALQAVSEHRPDLGLSLAAPILKASLFELPRLGTINLHKGKLPGFRGMPPAFWELWTDQPVVGCSVHRVNAKLDDGELLAADEVRCETYSTPRGLQVRLDEVGVRLVNEVVEKLLAGTHEPVEQPQGEPRTWRKPTLMQVSQLDTRLRGREPHQRGRLRASLIDVAAKLVFLAHRAFLWRVVEPRITVLLYHRVSDDARDNLTVGVAQFERQMALLRKHCTVLSLTEVLAPGAVRRSSRPLVAVTFDDGYRDNFLNAAPVLVRHRIPCAFFVSTGIVGSDKAFPHDVRRGNSPIPTMTWSEVRSLVGWGFVVGSHSVNHIDCAAEPAAVVGLELEASRRDLERELGLKETIFAYPYGGRKNMTPERLEMVKEAGYTACLAAYGGSNRSSVDRWNVLRRGIHWEFSDAAFLRQCLGT